MIRVFVYGTLRPGGANAAYLADAAHLGAWVSPARFTLLDTGAFPAALDTGAAALVGDVFALDAATLSRLDALEAYPVSYTRRLLATDFGHAWIYLWIAARNPRWPVIGHGDWRRSRRARIPARGAT